MVYVGTTVQYIFKFRLLYRAAHSICFLWYSTHCTASSVKTSLITVIVDGLLVHHYCHYVATCAPQRVSSQLSLARLGTD